MNMASKIQKKIAVALSSKKNRQFRPSPTQNTSWEVLARENEFTALIPSLTDLQINIVDYQQADSPKLHEVFQVIINHLKEEYFNHTLNQNELALILATLHQQTSNLSDKHEKQHVLEDYFTEQTTKVSLLYINSQFEIAIRFSKLAICVLSRQIKEALGVKLNILDDEAITKLLNELTERVPNVRDACLSWLDEQLEAYQPDHFENQGIATSEHNHTPSLSDISLHDSDTIKKQTLAELNQHKKDFNQQLLEYYANKELSHLLPTDHITKKTIRQAYRKLHNKLLDDLQLNGANQQKKLQQFIIEVINQHIQTHNHASQFSLEKIHKICDKQFKEQKSIILLCHKIVEQRAIIETYLTKLEKLAITDNTTHLIQFFTKKIKSPLFQKIENTLTRIIEQERYQFYKSFVLDLIEYTKALVLLPIYDSSIMLQINLTEPKLVKPLDRVELSHIKNCVKNLSQYAHNNVIKRECSYLLHTLTYNEELAIHLQGLEALILADLTELMQYLLDPFANPELIQLVIFNEQNLIASPRLVDILTHRKMNALKADVLDYQKNLRILGEMRLAAIQHPDNSEVNSQIEQQYNIINMQYTKLDVIHEMLNIVEHFSVDGLTANQQALFNTCKVHLSSMKETYEFLTNMAHEFGYLKIDPNDIFILRLTRGDFFNIPDHDILQCASTAMLFSLSPISILDGIIEHFDRYSSEQKAESLSFIESYLNSDSNQMLFSAIQSEKSNFYSKLVNFCNLAKQAELNIDNLNKLIKEKISAKQQRFSKMIDRINKGEFSKEELIRRIRTLSNKLTINPFHLTKLDEYIIEIANIFNCSTFVNFNAKQQVELQNIFEKLTYQCHSLPYYQQAFSKLSKNLRFIIYKKGHDGEKAPEKSLKMADSNVQNNLFMLIENSFNEVGNPELYGKILKKFISNVENELAILFTKVDICELRDLNWINDEQRLKDGLNLNAPHIRHYHESISMCLHFIRLSIFYSRSPSDSTPVMNDIQKIKRLVTFYEEAIAKALEIQAFTTASILYKALQVPAIQRLGFTSKKNKKLYQRYFGKTKTTQIELANLFREEYVLPLLSFIQHKLLFVHKKSYGSQFERLGNIGRILQEFNHKKEEIKKKIIFSDNSTLQQMYVFVDSFNILVAQSWQIEHEKSLQLITHSSYDVKPDISKKYQLSDFKSINGFMKHLMYCLSRSISHQLNDENPEKAIFDWMIALIKQDSRLVSFSDSLEVLYLLNDIAHTHKIAYKKFDADLIAILTLYYQKVSALIKAENEDHKSSLENFYNQFNKSKRIRDIKTRDDSAFDLFSHVHKQKELVKKIDDKYAQYQKIQILLEKHKSQLAYTQLLDDILSGSTTKTLPLAAENSQNQARVNETLLPENEYDVPSAEPEHPDRIGINRTMSFNEAERSSVLSLFNTDELKMEFLAAFPWALQFDNIDSLDQSYFDSNINLLGTATLFSNELQLAIMKFVLLAMDALGKIAGYSGELTIQNFDRISEIIKQLKWITLAIQYPDVSEQQLLAEVEAAVQEMSFRNNEYFEMQQLYNPPITVENNPNMNGFCHINEHLAYHLMGFHYNGSLLAPNVPSSPYFEKISEVLEGD